MADKKKSKSEVKQPTARKGKPVKPKKEKASPGGENVKSEAGGRGFTLSLHGDRSLQAYKDLVRGMLFSIKPEAKDTLTEEEWVERWKEFWKKADSAPKQKNTNTSDAPGISEAGKTKGTSLEDRYPGITEQIRQFKEAELPSCPYCGLGDTADVQVGIIGRTTIIAGFTRKLRLVPNMVDKLGKYYCNSCKKYFD